MREPQLRQAAGVGRLWPGPARERLARRRRFMSHTSRGGRGASIHNVTPCLIVIFTQARCHVTSGHLTTSSTVASPAKRPVGLPGDRISHAAIREMPWLTSSTMKRLAPSDRPCGLLVRG
jgi:hypothetical protein